MLSVFCVYFFVIILLVMPAFDAYNTPFVTVIALKSTLGFGVINPEPLRFKPDVGYDVHSVDYLVIEPIDVKEFLSIRSNSQQISQRNQLVLLPNWFVFLRTFLSTFDYFNLLMFNVKIWTFFLLDASSFWLLYAFFLISYTFYSYVGLNIYLYFEFLTSKVWQNFLNHFLVLYQVKWWAVLFPLFLFSLGSCFFSFVFLDTTSVTFTTWWFICYFYLVINYSGLYVILFWKVFLPLLSFFDTAVLVKKIPVELKWLLDPRVLFPIPNAIKETIAENVIKHATTTVGNIMNKLPPKQYQNIVWGSLLISGAIAITASSVVGYQYIKTQEASRDFIGEQSEVLQAQARAINANTNVAQPAVPKLGQNQPLKLYSHNPIYSKIQEMSAKKIGLGQLICM